MGHLTLSFLGTFEVLRDEKPLTHFRSTKVEGLLVYLVLNSHLAHRRDVLAALIWPEEPESIAKHNLRQSLFRLRKVLGDVNTRQRPYLRTTRTTVQFNTASDHLVDVASFLAALESEDRETAVSLYHGELLPGFSCDSLPFEDWLRQERERLHRLALDVLFTLTTKSLTQGDYQTTQRLARRQIALEPWREEAHRQLIQALFLMGERSAALAQVESCRTVLAEELGVELSSETEALANHIRQAQPAGQSQHHIHRALTPNLTIPFVGRQTEFQALVNAYSRISQQGLQVVAVVGKAGMGKTRLTQHFLDWAATQGADVLNGRSFETSAGLSYQPLSQLLRQRIERENAPEDLLSDLWLSQLARLLPELHERYPDLPPPTQEVATAKQHLFEAITRLGMALAARRPLVLFIDDWHWADTASLDLLHYTAVRWAEEKSPILIVLTLRQEVISESPDLQSWLTHFKRDVAYEALRVSELSQVETEQMIREILQSEAEGNPASFRQFSHWLFTETDGQPLFLTETLKAFVEDGILQRHATHSERANSLSGPGQTAWQVAWSKFDQIGMKKLVLPQVREIVLGWLERITPSVAALLTAASVLAQEASFAHLCRVAGLEEMQAIEALDALLSKQLLQGAEGEFSSVAEDPIYSFYHQKVSEVVYMEAGSARRLLLHRRAFYALKEDAAPSAELAYHALNANLLTETIHYSHLAGDEAMEIFAFQVAIRHYQTAWQMAKQKGWPEEISGADRQALYTSLGRAYELIEDWSKARDTYQAMLDYAQTIGAVTVECLSLNCLATVYLNGFNDPQQATMLLDKARTVAEQNNDLRGLAEIDWNQYLVAIREPYNFAHLHHGERALEIARQLGHPQLVARCLSLLGYVHARLRQWEMAEVYATEARQRYTAVGNLVLAADSQRLVGWCQIFSGRPQESLVTLQETQAFSQQIENLWGEAECARKLAYAHQELGDYGQAIKLAKQGVEQTGRVGHPSMSVLALSTWGMIQCRLMALDSAKETLFSILKDYTMEGAVNYPDWILAELCAAHALCGEWEQAYRYARQTLAVRPDDSLLPYTFTGWYETEALLRSGEEALARAEVERVAGIVGDNKRYQLPLLRSQAVLAQWAGEIEQASVHLQAALALAQALGLPGEAWPILGELGRLYQEQGEQDKAREAYGEAGTIIHHLAETIDEEGLREGFLTAVAVRSILQKSQLT